MKKAKKFLVENSSYFPQPNIILCMLIAFVFSVLCRLYWVYWASGFEVFYFNDELMIVSNDGYAFAEGARDMIAGFHQENDLSYFNSPLSTITFWLYKLTPFSFESIILYMSVFLSSLVIIPVLLLANLYKQNLAGLLAALLASVANSYYNRSMAGYYDTDMLVIGLAMLVLYFMIRLIIKKDSLSLIALPLIMSFYLWYYPSSYTLNVAFMGLFLIYTLLFHRKDLIAYEALILMIIALCPLAWYYQSLLFALLFALFAFKSEFFTARNLSILGALALILLFASGGAEPILYQLKFYIFKSDISAVSANESFSYFNVSKTIQEVGQIDLSTFMRRISSSEFAFLLSCVGFVLLLLAHRSAILLLPMIALGFLALFGGLRFTIYAVPVLALGYGFFVMKVALYFANLKPKKKELLSYEIAFFALALLCFISFLIFAQDLFLQLCLIFATLFGINLALHFAKIKLISPLIAAGALLLSVGFALVHIYNYKVSSVFTSAEANVLNQLKSLADREDYVISWWDYGYGIRYYSDVKTLADGGKHLGKDNFFPSFVLSYDEQSAANMARLSVEYTEKSFKTPYNDLLKAMMKDYNASNEVLFLQSLKNKNFSFKEPKTRDIYLYMPMKMALIFSTVASFSYIDLRTGEINKPFVFSPAFERNSEIGLNSSTSGFILSNQMLIEPDFTHLRFGENRLKINSIIEINDINKGIFSQTLIDKEAEYFVLVLKENLLYPMQFIILDKNMFESAFVQMFFLNKYDKDLFELVINEKSAKVFRLKK